MKSILIYILLVCVISSCVNDNELQNIEYYKIDPPIIKSVTALSNSSIKINWVENSKEVVKYSIYRSTTGNTFNKIAEVDWKLNYFTDNQVDTTESYWYKIKANSYPRDSRFSNTIKIQYKVINAELIKTENISTTDVKFHPFNDTFFSINYTKTPISLEIRNTNDLQILVSNFGYGYGFTIDRQGEIIASARDKIIDLWNYNTLEHIGALNVRGLIPPSHYLKFHPTSNVLYSSNLYFSHGSDIISWDIQSKQPSIVYESDKIITSFVFSPDGNDLVFNDNGKLYSINLLTNNLQPYLPYLPTDLIQFFFLNNNLFVAVNDFVNIYDLETHKLITKFKANIGQVLLSEKDMLVVTFDVDSFEIWDLKNGRLINRFSNSNNLNRGAFSLTSNHLILYSMDNNQLCLYKLLKSWGVD